MPAEISTETPIKADWLRDISCFIQLTWRPIGGLLCMIALAYATVNDPNEAKMWVAATAAGVGIVGRSAEKIMGTPK